MAKREIDHPEFYAMIRRLLRAASRRAADGDPEELAQLLALAHYVDQVAAVAVAGLRANGYTWEAIGRATGTTRQAALMRWATKSTL